MTAQSTLGVMIPTLARVAGALAGGYLIGTLPAAWLLVRVGHGVDLRRVGRGGSGAVDTMVAVGPRAAAAAVSLELAKGVLVAAGAHAFDNRAWFVLLALAGCVAGDAFPIGFRRGGRGLVPLMAGLLAALPQAFVMVAAFALLAAAFLGRRAGGYRAGVVVGVPAGVALGTGEPATLGPAALIVAVLLLRHEQRRRAREATLTLRGERGWRIEVVEHRS
jgi:glycerol-3-phosphate acyltransferase PlsY